MSNNTNTTAALGELFIDASREILEKGRIKAQISKLERIMNADKARLRNVYAEIGKMYVNNTLKKNSARLDYLYKAIAHLNTRLERAMARMAMLKEAHSVDECTEAFRAELSAKIKQAQDSAVTTAYNVKKKAQDAAATLGDKAEIAKQKAKEAILNITTKKEDAATDLYSEDNDKDFAELLLDLELEDDVDIKENPEIKDILNSLDDMLRQVEEDTTDSADEPAAKSEETPENYDF